MKRKARNNTKLTLLQERFVNTLFSMEVPNQRKAYMQVYKNCKKPESGDSLASRTLSIVKVKAYYDSLRANTEKKLTFTKAQVLNEIADIAFSKPRDSLKLNALENLGKHLGIYEADNTQKGDITYNIVKFSDVPALPAQKEAPKLVECTELVAEE